MSKVILSFIEQLWYDRGLKMAKEDRYNYVITWWLRSKYKDDNDPLNTTQINTIFRRLEQKGWVKIETTKSYTKVTFI